MIGDFVMDGKVLIEIAKISIASEFGIAERIDVEELEKRYPELKTEQATFVTLTIDGQLRGCIGSIIPHRSLLYDIVSNAKSAAFNDPRFPPLTPEEFTKVKIEVSLLSVPEFLEYSDIDDLRSKIRPGIDGVILQCDSRQATFLPQVWEELNSFELFFTHLCLKAGLQQNCLECYPKIFVYQVEKFCE